jgi:protein subunit release factor A
MDMTIGIGHSGLMSEREQWGEGPGEFSSLEEECFMEVFRSPSGRGAMTVRLTHLPTGIAAESSDGRTQLENRDRASRALRDRLTGGGS